MDNNLTEKIIKVGTGVFIFNDKNQVLFQKRTGGSGEGTWAIPGGHMEWQETFLDTAKREVKEEMDLNVEEIEVLGVDSDIDMDAEKHYITIYMKAIEWSGEPKIMEPDRCTEIGWFDLDKLPEPMFSCDLKFFELNPLCLCGSGLKYKQCHGKV